MYGIDGCAACVLVSNEQFCFDEMHQLSVVVLTVADVILPISLPARPGYCHRRHLRDSSSTQTVTVPPYLRWSLRQPSVS